MSLPSPMGPSQVRQIDSILATLTGGFWQPPQLREDGGAGEPGTERITDWLTFA